MNHSVYRIGAYSTSEAAHRLRRRLEPRRAVVVGAAIEPKDVAAEELDGPVDAREAHVVEHRQRRRRQQRELGRRADRRRPGRRRHRAGRGAEREIERLAVPDRLRRAEVAAVLDARPRRAGRRRRRGRGDALEDLRDALARLGRPAGGALADRLQQALADGDAERSAQTSQSDGPLLRELVLIVLGIRRLRGEDHLEEARRVLEVALDLRDLRRLAAVIEQLEDVDGQDDDGADVVAGLRVSVDCALPTHDVPRLGGLLEADARALDDRLGALDAGLARALVARVLVAAREPGLLGQCLLRKPTHAVQTHALVQEARELDRALRCDVSAIAAAD